MYKLSQDLRPNNCQHDSASLPLEIVGARGSMMKRANSNALVTLPSCREFNFCLQKWNNSKWYERNIVKKQTTIIRTRKKVKFLRELRINQKNKLPLCIYRHLVLKKKKRERRNAHQFVIDVCIFIYCFYNCLVVGCQSKTVMYLIRYFNQIKSEKKENVLIYSLLVIKF